MPADKDVADITIAVHSAFESGKPVALNLEGVAEDGSKTISADAVPAEDMMQAFIYRHLVPVDSSVDVRTPPPPVKTTP